MRAAERHYPETVLITDLPGQKFLVDRLGLSFAHVSTDLERLRDADTDWWALGKLVAYSLQDQPFVHLDTDVFLWNPLPTHLTSAPVFCQNPEYPDVHPLNSYGGPKDIERAFAAEGLDMPVEWQWERARDESYFREENCGIVGGCRADFLRHYAGMALDLVLNPAHGAAWASLHDKKAYNMIVEQFLLAACVGFHRHHPRSPYRAVRLAHLFRGSAQAYEHQNSSRMGYTHLGGAKCHPAVSRRMEERTRRDDPAFFRQCERLAAS